MAQWVCTRNAVAVLGSGLGLELGGISVNGMTSSQHAGDRKIGTPHQKSMATKLYYTLYKMVKSF